jgi:hypothetical protein
MPVNESWAEEPTWAADSAIGKPPKSEVRFSGEGRSTVRSVSSNISAAYGPNAAAAWLRHVTRSSARAAAAAAVSR